MKIEEMVLTTVSPCGTVAVIVIACCLLNITSEQNKTQEKKIVMALILIRRHSVYQTHEYIQNSSKY